MAFETLVEAGYQPELAYFETMHELKLIVDLMYRGGLNFMRFSVSDTAEYGDYVSGPRIIDEHVRETMQAVLKDIQDGTFANRWIEENESGRHEFERLRSADRDHLIERVGARLRGQMPFLNPVEVQAGQAQAAATTTRVRPGDRRGTAAVGPVRRAPASVRIFDTTLRDGEQAPGAGLTAAEKLEVARQLARLKVDVIEAGFPAASPGDFEAVRRIAQETKGGIAVAALARCKDGDPQRAIEAIKVAERPHLHVFIATSDIHLKHKLRIDRASRRLPTRSGGSATAASSWAATPRSSSRAEDASRTDTDYLLQVYEAVVEAGASTVNIPDTVGYAIPSEFGALVERVVDLVGGATPPSASTATTTWASRRPTRSPRSRRARARSRSRSTASASAPATPRSRRS